LRTSLRRHAHAPLHPFDTAVSHQRGYPPLWKPGLSADKTVKKGRLVEVYDYVQSGDKMKRKVAGHALLIPLERQEFPTKTVFPKKFSLPIVCSEFCDKINRCNLRENGFSDLCKHSHLLGTLVKASPVKFRRHAREKRAPVIWVKSSLRSVWLDDYESSWKTDRFGNYSHYTNPKLVPDTALAHKRTEDSRFAAYSSQEFMDTYDDPEDGHELEYTPLCIPKSLQAL
jgi:hypothetical protein